MIMYMYTCRCFVIGHENSLDLRHRDYYNIIPSEARFLIVT